MNAAFWRDVWRQGRTRFHEGRPNRFLERSISRYVARRRVLVPLCGKSEDLTLLAARGHEVVGVELSELAVRAFFDEHGLAPAVTRQGPCSVFRAGGVEIVLGDFFDVSPDLVRAPDAFYDRAAAIALPPELRARYVGHLRALLAGSPRGLLVTLEYAAGALEGPPFSIDARETRALWAGAPVEELERGRAELARLDDRGVAATEACYWIGGPT